MNARSIGRVRKLLGRPGELSEKYLMWRLLLDSSLTGAVHDILAALVDVGSSDFNFGDLEPPEVFKAMSREELVAYRRGAIAVADMAFRLFVKNFGGDEEEFIRNVESGLRVEENVNRLLDEEGGVPGSTLIR